MTQQEAAPLPPMPVPDPLTEFFWDGVKQHKLMILQCQSCSRFIHYPQPVCRFCLSTDLAHKQVSGSASLYSWTVTVQPFHPFWIDKVPYVLAKVELIEQDGLRMVTNIIDCPEDRLKLGMSLEVVFKEVGPGLTLPLFRPSQGR